MTKNSFILSMLLVPAIGCRVSTTPPPQAEPAPQPVPVVQPEPRITRDLVGKSCRISLRRDALGLAAPGLAEPMANMIGGKPALISGTVDAMNDSWLVVRGESKTYWIPTSAVLMIETQSR